MKHLLQWNSEYIVDEKKELPCMVCGNPTHFIEIFFEGRICSKECQMKMDKDYTEAVERTKDCNAEF